MNITAIRVGRTFNTGNYTSKKVEIEAIPDNGQSFDEAMAEVNAIVDAQNPGEDCGATTSKKPAAKKPAASSAPPFQPKPAIEPNTRKAMKGAKSDQADPTPATVAASTGPTTSPANDQPAAKPRGKKAKLAEHEKELQYMLDSTTLEELRDRFTNLRTMVSQFTVDQWEAAIDKLRDQYRALNSMTADKAVQDVIIAGAKAEQNYIANARSSEAAA